MVDAGRRCSNFVKRELANLMLFLPLFFALFGWQGFLFLFLPQMVSFITTESERLAGFHLITGTGTGFKPDILCLDVMVHGEHFHGNQSDMIPTRI